MFIIKNAESILLNAHESIMGGDVLIEGDRILAVGKDLVAPDAEAPCIMEPSLMVRKELHPRISLQLSDGAKVSLTADRR